MKHLISAVVESLIEKITLRFIPKVAEGFDCVSAPISFWEVV